MINFEQQNTTEMAVKNSNIVLYRNSVALDKGLRLVKSREKEKALEESNQIPYGGIMVIVQYGGTRYVKITDGAKTFAEIPKDGEGGSGGGDASTLNGQNGDYYRNRANHTGTQAASTITGLAPVSTSGSFEDLDDIPDEFPPAPHTHPFDQITGLAEGNFLVGGPDGIYQRALEAGDIATGTFDTARIPNLNASKINAGTFADARIPALAISKTTGLQAALDAKVGSEQESGVGTLISNIIQVTQAQYDGLTPQAGTFYAIVG